MIDAGDLLRDRILCVLSIGGADLWVLDLSGASVDLTAQADLLSPAERARAARYRREEDRRRFTLRRASLRTFLGTALGRPPAGVRFAHGTLGKPRLEGVAGEIAFNVSHSGDLAVVGLLSGGRIGVDVERIVAMPEMERIVRVFFSPAEKREFARLPAAERERFFYGVWTRKESVLKATGEGLSRPLDSFSVSVMPGDSQRLSREAGRRASWALWELYSFTPAPGYVGAVAIMGGNRVDRDHRGLASLRAMFAPEGNSRPSSRARYSAAEPGLSQSP